MAQTLTIDDPEASDDGKFLRWNDAAGVGNFDTAVTPAGAVMTGAIEFPAASGVILTASDGSRWRLVVSTLGALSTVAA